MTITYLKRAAKTPESEIETARKVVAEMLAEIKRRGEAAARDYALKLDQWSGDIVVSPQEIKRRTGDIPVAQRVMRAVPLLLDDLPAPAREAAGAAWRDYGEVVLCAAREEIVEGDGGLLAKEQRAIFAQVLEPPIEVVGMDLEVLGCVAV
jgi:histidinol dehydrogenase